MPTFDPTDKQGGKAFKTFMEDWEHKLDEINKEYEDDDDYQDVEDLQDKLQQFKKTFIESDQDLSGDLNLMDVKYMLEKMNQAKTHLELKKMIQEVDTTNSGVINYRDFLRMMLGSKSSVLKLILLFEAAKNDKAKPIGVAPKRVLSSLP